MENKNNATTFVMVTSEQLREIAAAAAEEMAARLKAEEAEELLTRVQACSLLQVNKTTLWRWEKCGYLHPVRRGAKVLYKKAELIANGGAQV